MDPVSRTLLELHYQALTARSATAGLFLLAKCLELVRELLPGRTDHARESSLPAQIRNGLKRSFHWLFDVGNNRLDVRHVVKSRAPLLQLHQRMTGQEYIDFRDDADAIVRTVISQRLGLSPLILRHEDPKVRKQTV
jgi:hypothetical protein